MHNQGGRKMGIQKQKWKTEEGEALFAGVAKHGAGKWKNILQDSGFSNLLINRSNVDLKDKWRNLSTARGNQSPRGKGRRNKAKDEGVADPSAVSAPAAATITPPPNANVASSSLAAPIPPNESSDELLRNIYEECNSVVDRKSATRYDNMIFEALSASADANGSDVRSIFKYIEPRHEVPPHFKRIISSRVRRLAAQGKVIKTQNFFKIPDQCETKPNETPAISQEMIEEAANTAAYELAEAENKRDEEKAILEEWKKVNELVEESENLLELAKLIEEQCSLDNPVWV